MKDSFPNGSAKFLWICTFILFALTEGVVILTFREARMTRLPWSTFHLSAMVVLLCVPAAAGVKGYSLIRRRLLTTSNDRAIADGLFLQLMGAIIGAYAAVMISVGALSEALRLLN